MLLVVESPELGEAQLDFLQKRAAADAAGPPLNGQKRVRTRAKQALRAGQGISLAELQKRETEFKAAQAALQAAKSAATAAENKLQLLGMDQPAVGRAGQDRARSSPGSSVLAPLDRTGYGARGHAGRTRRPGAGAPADRRRHDHALGAGGRAGGRLKGLKNGAKARVTLAALPDEKVSGDGRPSSRQTVDPATRTVKVRIEVTNADGELKPGMFARAEITSAANDDNGRGRCWRCPTRRCRRSRAGRRCSCRSRARRTPSPGGRSTVGKPVGGGCRCCRG